MNKNKKSGKSSYKIIWVLISYIGILCLTIGFASYGVVYERTGYGAFTDLFSSTDQDFLDSDFFNSMYLKHVRSLADYVRYKEVFETDNVYDGEKQICIESYLTDKEERPYAVGAKKDTSAPCYYLKDLLEWADSGYGFVEDEEAENTSVNVERAAGSDSGSETVSVTINEDASSYMIVEENADTHTYIRERFTPANGNSLYDFAGTENERYALEDTLLQVLDQISEDFIYYKELESKFAETNFKYLVFDEKTGNYYANTEIGAMQNMPGSKKEIEAEVFKNYGRFVELDSSKKGYATNMLLGYRELHDNFYGFSNLFEGDYYVATAVDTEFPVSDSFTKQDMPYEELLPWLRLVFCIMGVGILAVIAALIALTASAGVSNDTEEIKLCWFDKIKTEIAAVMILFLGFISFSVTVAFSYYDYTEAAFIEAVISMSVFASIFVCIEHTWFLIGYTSLVRRIKAHTMWSNSLCCWVMKGISSIMTNIKVTGRMTLYYTGFVLLNLFLMLVGRGAFVLLLLFVIDVLVGIKIIEEAVCRQKVKEGIRKISEGNLEYKIPLEQLNSDNRDMAEAVNHIGEGLHNAVEESLKNERLKTDLITNVSHDIKTPLTSIINYVDLLKRENIENEKIQGYIEILESKSQRLKHLTEDLVEVSKVSSGNISLSMEKLNFVELIHQTIGEFNEKFQVRNLELITNLPKEPVIILADGRRLWRVIENLYNNIAKYAMENTRVYADLSIEEEKAQFSLKNISAQALNFFGDELTERFIRGDVSRSTEGSGLGLSIAKSLTESQNGEFQIYLDGDLFKVTIRFDVIKAVSEEAQQEEPGKEE